jgi:two-component sensor histidine kinase
MNIRVRKILSKKFGIGLILIMILGNISAHAMTCDDLGLEKEISRLKQFIRINNHTQALSLSDSLLNILKKNKLYPCKLSLQIEYEKGEALELQPQFQEALDLYYLIIRHAENLKMWEMVANAHIAIARCHETISRPADCLRHLNIAKSLIKQHGLHKIESFYLVRYSSYFRQIENKDSAIVYAHKAVTIGKRDKVLRSIGDGYLLLGMLNVKIDTSIFYFRKAIEIFMDDSDYLGAGSQLLNIGSKLVKAKRITEAMKELDQAQYFIEKLPLKDKMYHYFLSKIYDVKKEVFERTNMIDSAYFYLQKSADSDKKAQWFTDQSAVSQKTIEFAIEKEQDKLKTSEKISRILKVGLGVMSVLMLALGWAVFNNYYKRKKIATQNKKIYEADQKKAVLLTEIHHRVKNNLQLVIGLMTIYGNKKENHQLKTYFDEISTKINSISIIHDQLSTSGEFEKLDMKVYLESLTNNFKNLFSAQNQFLTEYDVEEIHLNIETVLPLGIIFTELISNSLKHNTPSQETSIKVSIKRVEEKYILIYADNGPGYHETHNTKGNKHKVGLSLINNMVRQLQAEHSHYNDNGAVFKMIFQEKTVSKI